MGSLKSNSIATFRDQFLPMQTLHTPKVEAHSVQFLFPTISWSRMSDTTHNPSFLNM